MDALIGLKWGKGCFSNAVHGKCTESLTERGNYDLRFQMVVIQTPEAVRLSQAQYPWDI